jgi:hypothetical protein
MPASTTAARIKFNLETAGVPISVLAEVHGIAAATLQQNLRGAGIYLGAQVESDLHETSKRIAALAEALKPLSVHKNAPQAWAELLEGGVEADKVRELVSNLFGRGGNNG